MEPETQLVRPLTHINGYALHPHAVRLLHPLPAPTMPHSDTPIETKRRAFHSIFSTLDFSPDTQRCLGHRQTNLLSSGLGWTVREGNRETHHSLILSLPLSQLVVEYRLG